MTLRGLLVVASLLVPLASFGATPIYRSVGVGPGAPLVSNAGTLLISGTAATFSSPLPARIGVGDVIEYDSNGDGALDTVAFIHGRDVAAPGTGYSVRSASGAAPVPTAAATPLWSVFRAYTSLVNATVGVENAGIGAGWRDFDSSVNGRDLVAADETWNIACYDDGVDTVTAAVCSVTDPPGLESCAVGGNDGWRTDATHIIRIFTPVGPAEVGVSQRHRGTWGTGYRRTAGVVLHAGFIWVDGLSAMTSNERCFLMTATGTGGWVRVSNSFGWQTCPGCMNMRVFDIWSESQTGPSLTRIDLWNDIGIGDSTTDVSAGAFYLNSRQAQYWLHSCTGVARGGGYAFRSNNADLAIARNCLGVAATAGNAFSSGARWVELSTSAGNDPSVRTASSGAQVDLSAGVFPDQVFAFVDAGGLDFHLAPGDVGARGRGADLSANLQLAVTDDIDGEPRPSGAGSWDIGADQQLAPTDGGLTDGGETDAGGADAGSPDAGPHDGGVPDAGVNDAGSPDGGAPDAGSSDAGVAVPGPPRQHTVGCGCDSAAAAGPAALVLAASLRARRRRQAR